MLNTSIPEIAVGVISTSIGFIMSDATWALLIGQAGIVAIMLVKDRRDRVNREQDRLDRELAAKIAAEEINKRGDARKVEIVEEVKKVVESVASSTTTETQPH
jgi:hypothetical protein